LIYGDMAPKVVENIDETSCFIAVILCFLHTAARIEVSCLKLRP
jgi:hypothetical protein